MIEYSDVILLIVICAGRVRARERMCADMHILVVVINRNLQAANTRSYGGSWRWTLRHD
jgi:hypothetical protein